MKNVNFKYLTSIAKYELSYNKIGKEYVQVICTHKIRKNEILFITIVHHTREESNIFKYYGTGICMIANGIDFNKIIIEALDKEFGYI